MNELEKLYNGLKERGLYSKSFEEFQAKYSTPEEQRKLFEGLSQRSLYSKTYEDFTAKYFGEKKNPESSGTGQQPTKESETPTDGSSDTSQQGLLYDPNKHQGSSLNPDLPKGQQGEISEEMQARIDKTNKVFEGLGSYFDKDVPVEEAFVKSSLASLELTNHLWNTFRSAVGREASAIANFPDYVGKSIMGLVADKEALAEYNKMTPEQQNAMMRGIYAQGGLQGQAAAGLDIVSEKLKNWSKQVDEKKLMFEQNIVDDIGAGNFAKAGFRTIDGIVDSAPMLAVTAMPGGLGVMGAMSASREQQEAEEAGVDLSPRQVANWAIKGSAEAVFELPTKGLLKRVGKALKGNKAASDAYAKGIVDRLIEKSSKVGKTLPGAAFLEASSEAATELVQSLSESFVAGNTDFSWVQLLKDMADAGIIGGVMGAGFNRVENVAKDLRGHTPEGGVTELNIKAVESVSRNVLQDDIDLMVKEGMISEERGGEIMAQYDAVSETLSKIPDNMKEDKKAEAASILRKKMIIEKQMEGKDPALVEKQKLKVEELDARLKTLQEGNFDRQVNSKETVAQVYQDVFGQTPEQAQASAAVTDAAVGAMAERAGISKEEMYGKIKFRKGDKGIGEGTLYQEETGTYAYRSNALEALKSIDENEKGSPEKWFNLIIKRDGKAAKELDWIDFRALEEYVGKKKSYTKEDIRAFINAQTIVLTENISNEEKAKIAEEQAEVVKRFDDELRDLVRENRTLTQELGSYRRAISGEIRKIEAGNRPSHKGLMELHEVFNFGQEAKPEAVARIVLDNKEVFIDAGVFAENQIRDLENALKYLEYNFKEQEIVTKELKDYKKGLIYRESPREVTPTFEEYTEDNPQNYREIRLSFDRVLNLTGGDLFKHGHFPYDENVVVHTRVTDRKGTKGEKVLFAEEIQSDWAQAGKREGFVNPEIEGLFDRAADATAKLDNNVKEIAKIEKKYYSDFITFKDLTGGRFYFQIVDGKLQGLVSSEREAGSGARPLLDPDKVLTKEQKEVYDYLVDNVYKPISKIRESSESILKEYENDSRFKVQRRDSNVLMANLDKMSTYFIVVGDNVDLGGDIPLTPWQKTQDWVGLMTRRLLLEAVRNNQTHIAWTTGEQQNTRYRLSRVINGAVVGDLQAIDKTDLPIAVSSEITNNHKLIELQDKLGKSHDLIVNPEGKIIHVEGVLESLKGNSLSQVIGAEMSSRVLNANVNERFDVKDNEVGGEGMIEFYNNVLPNIVQKQVRRLDKNAKVAPLDIVTKHTFDDAQYVADIQPLRKEYKAKSDELDVLSSDIAEDFLKATDYLKNKTHFETAMYQLNRLDKRGAKTHLSRFLSMLDYYKQNNRLYHNKANANTLKMMFAVLSQQSNTLHPSELIVFQDLSNSIENFLNPTRFSQINKKLYNDYLNTGGILRKIMMFNISKEELNEIGNNIEEIAELPKYQIPTATKQYGVEITPEMRMNLNNGITLFQDNFGAMTAVDGEFIIHALTNPNVSTPMHELAHVYEHYLTKEERAEILKDLGHKEWTVETSEAFARGFEKYLAKGEAPTAELRSAFAKFKNWLTEIYNGLFGGQSMMTDGNLSPVMAEIYSKMLGKKIESAPERVSFAEANSTIRMMMSKARNGERKEVIQKLYATFVKKVIDSKQMPAFAKRELNAILKGIQDSKTTISLVTELNKVLEIVTDLEVRRQKGVLGKTLKRKSYYRKSGKRTIGSLAEEETEIIKNLRDLINHNYKSSLKGLSTEQKTAMRDFLVNENDKRIAQIQDELNNGDESNIDELASRTIYRHYLAAETSETSAGAVEHLTNLNEELAEVVDKGRSKRIEFEKKRANKRKAYLEAAREDTGFGLAESEKTADQLANERTGLVAEVRRFFFKIGSGNHVNDLRGFFKSISTKGDEDAEGGYLSGDLYPRLIQAATQKEANARRILESIDRKTKEIYKTGRLRMRYNRHMAERLILPATFPVEKGNPVKEDVAITRAQAIYLWMNYHNPATHKSLEVSGYDKTFMEALEKKLTDKDKQYAQMLFDFYDEHHSTVSEVYKNMYGVSLGKQPFYAGRLIKDNYVESEVNLLDMVNVSNTVGSGSLKERNGRASRIQLQGAGDALASYVRDMEHFKAFAEVHQEYTNVFKDPKVRANVWRSHKYGADIMLEGIDYVRSNDMERGGYTAIKMRFLQKVMNNIVRAALAIKPKIALTQMISMSNAFAFLPNETKYWQEGLKVENLKEAVENSDYLKNRLSKGRATELMASISNVNIHNRLPRSQSGVAWRTFTEVYNKYMDMMMLPVKFGDMVGVGPSLINYGAWKAKYIEQGMTEEQAKEKALLKMHSSIDVAQQTQTSFGKSKWQKNPILNIFSMFQTAPLQNYRNTQQATRELYRLVAKGKAYSKGSVGNNVYRLINFGFIQPVVYAYVTELFLGNPFDWFDDDEKANEADKAITSAMLLRNSGSVPFYGQIALFLLEHMILEKKHTFGGFAANPVMASGEQIQRELSAAESTMEVANVIRKHIGPVVTGLPTKTIENYKEAIDILEQPDTDLDFIERLALMLGWSPFKVNERRKMRRAQEREGQPRSSTRIKRAGVGRRPVPRQKRGNSDED